MTIEDPVEYVFPSINQIQTNEQAGLTFATGLRSILRQDPDVILVGEIRDVETTRVAVQSALTATSWSRRFTPPTRCRPPPIPGHGYRVVSHRLIGTGRRRPETPAKDLPVVQGALSALDEELVFYEESGGPAKDDFFQGTGCNFCTHTGYKDRIGIYELLIMTRAATTRRRLGDPGRAAQHGSEAGDAHPSPRGRQPCQPGHHVHFRSDPERLHPMSKINFLSKDKSATKEKTLFKFHYKAVDESGRRSRAPRWPLRPAPPTWRCSPEDSSPQRSKAKQAF